MNFILDIVILVIIAVFVIIGIKRGFVQSAARFVGAILAAVFSSILGGAAAQWIFDTLFRESLTEKIGNSINESVSAGANASNFISTLPDFIVRILEDAGITEQSIGSGLESTQQQVAQAIVDGLAPAFVGIIKIVTVIVLFMIFMFVVNLIANFLNGVVSLPVLSSLNSLLGIGFGVLRAVVLIWIVFAVMSAILPILSNEMQADIASFIDGTVISKFFINANPFNSMF